MTEAERDKYVAWWLYESGLDVDELIGIAVGVSLMPAWVGPDGGGTRVRSPQKPSVRLWPRQAEIALLLLSRPSEPSQHRSKDDDKDRGPRSHDLAEQD